jgi:hypothetical protein
MLLAMAERRLGVADRLARCFPDRRDPTRITHTLSDMIRARIFAISCGYEDADDLDFLRTIWSLIGSLSHCQTSMNVYQQNSTKETPCKWSPGGILSVTHSTQSMHDYN